MIPSLRGTKQSRVSGIWIATFHFVSLHFTRDDESEKCNSQAITRTFHHTKSTSGIFSFVSAWYLGVIILCSLGRFTQSCTACCTPHSRENLSVMNSLCNKPLPAVIHWTSSAPMIPPCQAVSWCSTSQEYMIVTVSNPLCGWYPTHGLWPFCGSSFHGAL